MNHRTKPRALLPDDQIIELYWQRDERAIEETDRKYASFLFRLAYNILHDQMDCEECRNDTYLRTWNTVPPTRPTVFPAYLTQIMRHLALDRYRERSSMKRVPSELTVSMEDLHRSLGHDSTPQEDFERNELARLISDYVRSLSPRARYLFIERYYMSQTLEQIADDLGQAPSTIHRQLNKIKQGLRLHLERNGVTV